MKSEYSNQLKRQMRDERRQARLEQLWQWYEALRPVWELTLGIIVATAIAAFFAYAILMWFTEPSLNGTY